LDSIDQVSKDLQGLGLAVWPTTTALIQGFISAVIAVSR
jgi:hypothetical protein